MAAVEKQIEKLIETGNCFNWEDNSRYIDAHDDTYGKVTPEWKIWQSRINKLLQNVVKTDSEAFVYYRAAKEVVIEGNYSDEFDLAKENYMKALNTAKSLFLEGDIFNELLVPEPTLAKPKSELKQKNNTPSLTSPKNDNEVFIVHGHDHTLKIELEVFLSHIGLKPIVLHREIDGGKTIIEKFEANSDVAFAFILLTPDELSYTIDQEAKPDKDRKKESRARPNVIFEFGYFVAKLGREKVCALHKGDVSIPSDLSGFIYKKVEQSIEEIGFSLIKELKAAGLRPEL